MIKFFPWILFLFPFRFLHVSSKRYGDVFTCCCLCLGFPLGRLSLGTDPDLLRVSLQHFYPCSHEQGVLVLSGPWSLLDRPAAVQN